MFSIPDIRQHNSRSIKLALLQLTQAPDQLVQPATLQIPPLRDQAGYLLKETTLEQLRQSCSPSPAVVSVNFSPPESFPLRIDVKIHRPHSTYPISERIARIYPDGNMTGRIVTIPVLQGLGLGSGLMSGTPEVVTLIRTEYGIDSPLTHHIRDLSADGWTSRQAQNLGYDQVEPGIFTRTYNPSD